MNERVFVDPAGLHKIVSKSGVVFDTNVWLRVDGYLTDSRNERSRKYSWLYKEILNAQTPIYLPQIVLSEYVKVSLVAMAKDAGWTFASGIKIHQHSDYDNWIENVSDAAYHISKAAIRLDDEFSNLDVDDCLDQCKNFSIDFNDVLISKLCDRHSLMLVTDDADLGNQAIPIASANTRLAPA